ncbi:maternal B9.15 protein [Stigmatopora argus]
MKREVKAGVNFLKRLVMSRGKIDEAKGQLFAEKLQQLLCAKFEGHWYPECPSKGQAFRCIRINEGLPNDEMLLKACEETQVLPSDLCLPPEITVWIDPMEVCVRSRENGFPFSIACFTDNEQQEDSLKKVRGDSPTNLTNHDTSDYHSATSSDCGSTVCSDTEEEAKDGEVEGEQENKALLKEQPVQDDNVKITMVPRILKRHGSRSKKAKYSRNGVRAGLQYYFPPVPAWSHCKNGPPVFLTTVAAPPPTPLPHHQLFVHYMVPQHPPQFIIPQTTLQPCVFEALKKS